MDGAIDQYLRIVGYNLNILLLLMLSANVNGLKYVLRVTALLLAAQEATVWLRLLGHPEHVAFVQTWILTGLLWLLVVVLAITILATGKVKQ